MTASKARGAFVAQEWRVTEVGYGPPPKSGPAPIRPDPAPGYNRSGA
jgi:hypothetical protein